VGGFVPAQVFQKQGAGQQHRARVGDVLAGVFRGGTVGGFEHGGPVADIGAGGQADATGHGGGSVRQVVAVEVGRGDHAVFVRPELDLLKHAVGDAVLDKNFALGR